MSAPLKPVLLIACHFPPEGIIGSQRPGRFFRYLPEFGYEPYVVTASPQTAPDPHVAVAPFVNGLSARLMIMTVAPSDDRPTWASAAYKAGVRLLEQTPCRAILSTSPPYSVHSAAAKLARRFRIPWVADIRDPLVGNASRRTDGIFGWIDRRMEQTILAADAIVLNTIPARDDWKRRHPAQAGRMEAIYNGFDPADLPAPAGPIPVRPHRILLHAGSLYMPQYVGILLRALRTLHERGKLSPDTFRFQLIGAVVDTIPVLEDFRYLAERGILENGGQHLPQAEARQKMRDSDFLLLVDYYRPGGSLQLPAKLFDYLPVGRPILAITTPDSPMHRTLEISGLPNVRLFPTDDANQVLEKIAKLLVMPAGPHPLQPAYVSSFDGRNQTAELARIFDRLLPR